MNEPTHDQLKELIAPYALGAVDETERGIVRDHILSCEECMREADEYTNVTAWLDQGVEPVDVPAGFADRVLDTVREARPTVVTPPARSWFRSMPRWGRASAAAMFVAIAVLAFSLVQTRNDLNLQERVVAALVREDGMDLDGPTGAVAKMVPTSHGALLAVSGLDPAPEDHTYQLWLIEGDQPASAGLFEVSNGKAILEVDDSLEGVDAVAVTVEPEGGSPQPTSDPVISTT